MDPETHIFKPRRSIQRAPPNKVPRRNQYIHYPDDYPDLSEHEDASAGSDDLDVEHAIPFGWDVKLIAKLVLWIELGPRNKEVDAMDGFEWPMLGWMMRLRSLRIVVTYWRPGRIGCMPSEQVFDESRVLGDGYKQEEEEIDVSCSETVAFRHMMSILFSHKPTGCDTLCLEPRESI
ncbi:hypothetical protein K505DRAFT_357791 [Melanomma pulvis-pyrius CBS 109.77]|uniref:Uncharacterized protein n=1 Tax=Melanomma pulvis-pyrius CBS 109.77 TaxID=1314802 RepID=A0A6A6XP88_9PLEO|nr:hypothetical protein K505DRAFT_357791 [Melanomma pulvis-pyrius CBS 109.77]